MDVVNPKRAGAFALLALGWLLPLNIESASGQKNISSTPPSTASQNQALSAATMQLQRGVTGDLLYRFLSSRQASAPITLPSPSGTKNIVVIPLPASLNKNAVLEIIDSSSGKTAHLPVKTTGVTPITDASFTMIQSVFVPVMVQGKGALTDASVTVSAKGYSSGWLLKASDKGVAQFANVPIGIPVKVSVQNGGDSPVSQTQTLPSNPPADGFHWQTITVNWTDAHTVPVASAVTAPAASGFPAAPSPSSAPQPVPPSPSNPLSSLISFLVSLAILAGIAYGLFYTYKNGQMKRVFENLGIHIQSPQPESTAVNPFAKPERAPIQPITEGTADPFAGGVSSVPGAYPIPSGARLVGSMGTYSGSIFSIQIGQQVDIGRDPSCAVPLPNDTNVSRRHATLLSQNGDYILTDNNSSNGTFLNGVKVPTQTPQSLRPGDEVQIGSTRFRFEI